MANLITALYDCRSKQEYIYRTNKVREIAGGSVLLAHVYGMFIDECEKHGIIIDNNWKSESFSKKKFEESDKDGVVIYEGGGNLYVLYKSREIYLNANRIFSKMLLDETYTINVIASCVEASDDFNKDREMLYKENRKQKNLGSFSVPCNALPFTQLDRNTWMPVAKKSYKNKREDLSREAVHKRNAYEKYCIPDKTTQSENLDSLIWEKNNESLLAVIYIDGNAMGNKIKSLTTNINDYDKCVNILRKFSLNTNKVYVDAPLKRIEQLLEMKRKAVNDMSVNDAKKRKLKESHKYRKIVGGGDEITIICNARDAKDIILEYFKSLESSSPLVSDSVNASCAGIAIFHSHDPFSEIYKIAEACCEKGKEKTRLADSRDNYIDFHYCHSGIVNDLDTIRAEQEEDYTQRPYRLDKFIEFCNDARILSCIGRQNIKTLRDSTFKGKSYFDFETERILSRYPKSKCDFYKLREKYGDNFKRFVYDVSIVYDLWFAKEEELNEKD